MPPADWTLIYGTDKSVPYNIKGTYAMTYEILTRDAQARAYIKAGDDALSVLGFTEHSFTHVSKTADTAANVLLQLGYTPREAELARMAGFLHDVGNMINRHMHALLGAEIARNILERLGTDFDEIGRIVAAVGNHDEETGRPVNVISAALILGDKTDVRRSRVREQDLDQILADIHDRVNYAVTRTELQVIKSESGQNNTVRLCLDIDIEFCAVSDYFEIFLPRMIMCRRAAAYLNAVFELYINGLKVM